MEAYVSEGEKPIPECIIAETATNLGAIPCVRGFGSSDCKCHTHLFQISPEEKRKMISVLDLTPFSSY
jgi:Uri superfamily endonuclease